MDKEDLKRTVHAVAGVTGFDPASYAIRVANLLQAAPLEEWRRLVPALLENKAELPHVPRHAAVQRVLGQQMAILLFAAEQLGKVEVTGKDFLEGLMALAEDQEKGGA